MSILTVKYYLKVNFSIKLLGDSPINCYDERNMINIGEQAVFAFII